MYTPVSLTYEHTLRKTDFDSFFRRVFSTVPSPTDPVHALAKDLYSKSTRILQQCYGVLRKEGHENAIGEELVFVEGDGEDMGRGIKKTRQRGALVSEMGKPLMEEGSL